MQAAMDRRFQAEDALREMEFARSLLDGIDIAGLRKGLGLTNIVDAAITIEKAMATLKQSLGIEVAEKSAHSQPA